MAATNLIDQSYFEKALAVPQKETAAVLAKLQAFIDQYEREYLERILGYELHKNFRTAFEAGGVLADKWKDLKEGKEFVGVNNHLTKWDGFVFTQMDLKRSPIANYVFFQYLRHEASAFTPSGEVTPATQNASPANPLERQCRIWNEMVGMNNKLFEFLYQNQDVYGEYFQGGFTAYYARNKNLFCTINPLNL